MGAAEDNYKKLSTAQQREINTACVLVALGGKVQSCAFDVIYKARNILQIELTELQKKKTKDEAENLAIKILQEIIPLEASVSGLKKLEKLADGVMGSFDYSVIKILKPIAEKCWRAAPAFLQNLGFGQLIYQRKVSAFIEFALRWKYSAKGYEAPNGMSEPFFGYDQIINSLMGHPLCKELMAKEAKAWEKAHKK